MRIAFLLLLALDVAAQQKPSPSPKAKGNIDGTIGNFEMRPSTLSRPWPVRIKPAHTQPGDHTVYDIIMRRNFGQIRRCWEKTRGPLGTSEVELSVLDGRTHAVRWSGEARPKAEAECMRRSLEKLSWPKQAAELRYRITFTGE
jgi:hypothetical protein